MSGPCPMPWLRPLQSLQSVHAYQLSPRFFSMIHRVTDLRSQCGVQVNRSIKRTRRWGNGLRKQRMQRLQNEPPLQK